MDNNLKQFFLFDKIIFLLEKIIRIIVMISVGTLSIVLIVAVFVRYFLNNPILGANEISLYLLGWITLLGTVLAVQRQEMVSFNLLIEKLPIRLKKILFVTVQSLIIAFSVVFLIYSIQWVFSPVVLNATSPSLQLPMWIVYIIFPFSMISIILFCLYNIRNQITKRGR